MKELFKLSPVGVIGGLMFAGMNILLAASIAFLYAMFVGVASERFSFSEMLDAALENLSYFMVIFLILELSYAVAECFMGTGVAAAVINISLDAGLNARTVAVVSFLITSVLSAATGTSWGTFAAAAPIFLWLNHIVGGSAALTLGAIAGGSCFGDNIGLISDTTIISSAVQRVRIVDRIHHQGVWSLLCLAASAAVFYAVSVNMGLPETTRSVAEAMAQIPANVWERLDETRPSAVALLSLVEKGVPTYMVVPLVMVVVAALAHCNTLVCLAIGIFSSLVIGLMAGTVGSVSIFLNDFVLKGFMEAGSRPVPMMLWCGAFGGVMKKMDAFAPIAVFVLKSVRKVRHLMFANALLCLLGNAALADEMAQVVTISPILSKVTKGGVVGSKEDIYTLSLRNATFEDAMGVIGSQLIPWHSYTVFFMGIAAAVYPFPSKLSVWEMISHNYFAFIAVGSMLFLTFTGFDRFIPLFGLPSEPRVRIKGS